MVKYGFCNKYNFPHGLLQKGVAMFTLLPNLLKMPNPDKKYFIYCIYFYLYILLDYLYNKFLYTCHSYLFLIIVSI